MSLKARLRIVVVVLMISVVSTLSALFIYRLAEDQSQDALKQSKNSLQQVGSYVVQRLREQVSTSGRKIRSGDDARAVYTDIVRGDDELSTYLEHMAGYTKVIVEILVAGDNGEILSDSLRDRKGDKTYTLPDFSDWLNNKSSWGKLYEVFSRRQDYQLTLPLGLPDQQRPLFTVKVVVSSVFLREAMLPQLQSIALIVLGALFLSTLLAVVVSNLALRPLDTVSQALDRISTGEFGKVPALPDGAGREFTTVQSKLNLLGQQFRGAREDVNQLRSNIEQLLEKLEEVVLLFDRDDRLVMAGRAAERLLGRGRWELMGRTLAELFPAETELGSAIHSALELRQPLRDHPILLERDRTAATRVLLNVEMLEGFPRHERLGTLITLRDAETRLQIQSQLDVSTRLAAISRLTGSVAHEIKNPLQAMRVHLEVLRSKLQNEGIPVETEIDTIDREIMRLDRVVKTFLDFTRPVDLQMRELEMVKLVREVILLVGPAAQKQQVATEVETAQEEIWIHGDRDLLQQAILNVVVNGVEAMKSGGHLRIRVRLSGGDCLIAIADEGPGIPPEIRDKVFNLYFSTKGKGSGIGLAMAFRVVQLHNGTIDFTSEPGKGTTFRLRFPAVDRETHPAAGAGTGEQRLTT